MNNETFLSGKTGLAGIQWALQSRSAHTILRDGLRQILETGCQIGPFELTRAKFKLNSRLLAYYSFTVTNPEAEEKRPVSMEVTWMNPAKDNPGAEDASHSSTLEMQAEASRSGLLKPFQQLQYAIPNRDIMLRIWPLDPVYPQLVRLGNPAYIPHLFQLAGIPIKVVENDCVKVTPIRYRPGERHVLRYQIDTQADPSGQEKVYAKLYQDPTDAARAYRVATKVVSWLGEAVAGQPGIQGLRGNQPLGVSQEDAAILYPHAVGIPLSQQLHRSPAWLSRQLRLVGSALATLHRGPETLAPDLKENIIEKEIKVIARAFEHIHILLPELSPTITRVLERIQELYNGLPQEKPTFTHSDFKADHLFISPAGITLIDFDTCAMADPALDIGKFMADLEWWHEFHHITGAAQAQQEFLKGYNNQEDNGRLIRARLYQSLILAKIAVRRTRLYSKDWAAVMTKMVYRSEAILQNLTSE